MERLYLTGYCIERWFTVFVVQRSGHHRDPRVRTHSFPTRRSSDLTRPRVRVGRKTRLPRRRRPRTTTKNAPASRRVGVHRTGRQGRPASVLFLFGLDFLLGLDRLPGGRCRVVAGIHGGGGLAFGGDRKSVV